MKMFCTCGAVSNYELTPPKFCSGCGQPFGGTKHEAKATKPKFRKAEADDDELDDTDDDDEEEEVGIPDLSPQDIKINCEFAPDPRVSVASLMAGVAETPARERSKRLTASQKKTKQKQFLKSLESKTKNR